MNKIFERFSSRYGLKKFIVWILRYRDNLRSAVVQRRSGYTAVTKKTKVVPITLGELRNADKEILTRSKRKFRRGIDNIDKGIIHSPLRWKKFKASSQEIEQDSQTRSPDD